MYFKTKMFTYLENTYIKLASLGVYRARANVYMFNIQVQYPVLPCLLSTTKKNPWAQLQR